MALFKSMDKMANMVGTIFPGSIVPIRTQYVLAALGTTSNLEQTMLDSDYEIAKARDEAVKEARGQRLLRTMKAEIDKCAAEVVYLATEKDDIPPHHLGSLWEGFCHQVATGTPEDVNSYEEPVRAICGQVVSTLSNKSSLGEWMKDSIYRRVVIAAKKPEFSSHDRAPEDRHIEQQLLRAVDAEIDDCRLHSR
jgi:hypothetical protein